MRVDKIELIGFKSFGERTVFNFHPGITCIVGPNGCGKSNIVDAFRWVLGEQSAKSLRGEKMEEVIFSGSTSKKPRGMAEVTMVLSGIVGSQQSSQGENGENTDTVSVTRRLYRSGDSEYMLNKSQCRLKDIRDLFLDTGLEVKSYSILEQDRIAEILNSKPQERRFLIEEVAGVMKYNVRRKEAISKLESSRTNLQRVNDIIIEVKKQISFLDRLAKKAERYKRLTSEKNAIELKIAKKDYRSLKDSFDKIVSELNVLKEEESIKRAELSKTENETETKRIEILEREKILEKIQVKYQGIEKEIAELEKSIAVARTERDNFREYLIKLYQQQEEYDQKKAESLSKQEELENTGKELLSESQIQKELLTEKSDFVKSLEEKLLDFEDLLEEKRREIFRVSEELSTLRNNQNKLQSSLESLIHREEASLRDSEGLKKMLTEVDSSLKDIELSILDNNNNIMLLNERKGIITSELAANKNRVEQLRDTLSRFKEELASNTSRIESIKEFLFDDTTKELLTGNTDFNLLASIFDVFEVDDEYEKAIESVLSEKVNSFILPSFDDIDKAVSALKKKGLGRAAFIPLHPNISAEKKDAPTGVIANALSVVRTKEDFSGIAESMFGSIFIVKDIKTAFSLIADGHNLLFVTLDGDVIEPSGAVIAGEVRGVFKMNREMREIEAAVDNNKASIDQIQIQLNTIQGVLETKESELKYIEAAIVEKEKEISLMRLSAENYREDRERRSRKLAYLTLEIEQIIKEKAAIEKLLGEKDTEIHLMESKKTESENKGLDLQEEIVQRRLHLEEYRAEVTDIRLLITSFREKMESVGKEKDALQKELIENSQKKEFLSGEIVSVNERISQREKETEENEGKIRSLVAVADELRKEIAERKEIIDTENDELLTTEHGLKQLRSQIEIISHRTSELDVQRAEHRLKIENIYESINQNYGLAIDTVEVEPLTEEDEQRLEELRQKVQELGPVNLGTLEEYEELRTRYEFLKNQQEDLNRSIAELEEAITKINITTRKKLREAFEALKIKFSEVFLTLFGGGRAELVMTDENNILETGIDIIAQPPGKRLQNINLLSGGEKTLTALSLLFSSFLIRPKPLCILDEADSALDEVNTEKFSNMVRDFSKDTQFIVVTHNRHTMSISDYIYGITMEEAGVSKVISMQLVEAQNNETQKQPA
jgi:chromosome segregation protein